MSVRIPVTSKQYYEKPLTSLTTSDPTTLPVLWAFTPSLAPPDPATAGSWVTRTENGEDVHYARIQVGGTGTGAAVELDPGLWHAWAKIDGTTEDPVTRTGILVIEDAEAFTLPPAPPSTTEIIQDAVGAMVAGNTETGIAVTYDDVNGRLDFVAEVTQAELDLASLNVYNVKSYFAVGNGTTDDRAAIQAALSAAGAAGGGIVHVPPGTYLIKRPLFIPSKVTLRGAGMGVSTITKPASVKSVLTVNASAGATSVTVTDSTGFVVGGPVHIYDTTSWEWNSTQGTITGISGNVITFTNAEGLGHVGLDGAVQTTRSAAATTSFPLIRNELASTRIGVRDLTLDHNQNANDPAPTSGLIGGVADFTLATIHWVETYYSLVENVELLNASGDAYSDQAQDGAGLTPSAAAIKVTKNTIRGCRIRNATRHAVHLGTCMEGAYVLDNEMTNCAWYALFYCAYATYTVARGNLVQGCGSGFAGIDDRDYNNVIANNIVKGTTVIGIDAVATTGAGGGGRLSITGNEIAPISGRAIAIDHPDCTIASNVVVYPTGSSATAVELRGDSDRALLMGNSITIDGTGSAGSLGIDMLAGADDCRLIGNSVRNFVTGVEVRGVNRLVATGNHFAGTTARGWYFVTATSTDCVIKNERNVAATIVQEDVATTRLVYEGMGTNGAANPATSGAWNGISGRRYDGQLVRWNSGSGEQVSVFYNGVGWTTLNLTAATTIDGGTP